MQKRRTVSHLATPPIQKRRGSRASRGYQFKSDESLAFGALTNLKATRVSHLPPSRLQKQRVSAFGDLTTPKAKRVLHLATLHFQQRRESCSLRPRFQKRRFLHFAGFSPGIVRWNAARISVFTGVVLLPRSNYPIIPGFLPEAAKSRRPAPLSLELVRPPKELDQNREDLARAWDLGHSGRQLIPILRCYPSHQL